MSGESHGGENVRGNVRIPLRHTRLERALGFVMRRTRFDTQSGDRRVRTLSKLLTRNCSASEGCKDITSQHLLSYGRVGLLRTYELWMEGNIENKCLCYIKCSCVVLYQIQIQLYCIAIVMYKRH